MSYKEEIYKKAGFREDHAAPKQKKEDPFRTTKIIGLSHLAGLPLDVALDTAVEGADMMRTKAKGIKAIDMFKTPESRLRIKNFFEKQLKTALPMNLGMGALMTAPVAAYEYNKYKQSQKQNKIASYVEGIYKKAEDISNIPADIAKNTNSEVDDFMSDIDKQQQRRKDRAKNMAITNLGIAGAVGGGMLAHKYFKNNPIKIPKLMK